MDRNEDRVRIELTAEQKATVRTATGQDADAIELSVEELEERIAPRYPGGPSRGYRRPLP